jgi:Mn-dependent DtxR family transcriptional regulator
MGNFEEAFAATGRAPSSYGSVVHGLQKEGIVQNKGDGYTLTKKGRDRARYVK